MARKDLFKTVMESTSESEGKDARAGYALRGASKSMKVSIDHMAENAKKMLEGETIVEIDPACVDVSFVNDRLTGDDEAYQELKRSIAAGTQDTPVLLRPHPKASDRYMIVFGHRRVRVAFELGRTVRAIVKPIGDITHILAQGQENTARADLSFIEKALFAKNLIDLDYDKALIQSALTVDATLLSRLLSVSQKIPQDVIRAIGAAKSVGRDRWEEMKKLIVIPANGTRAREIVTTQGFLNAESDRRFEVLLDALTEVRKSKSKTKAVVQTLNWSAGQGRIKGVLARSRKGFNISLMSEDAALFGAFLSENLDHLYQSFQSEQQEKPK